MPDSEQLPLLKMSLTAHFYLSTSLMLLHYTWDLVCWGSDLFSVIKGWFFSCLVIRKLIWCKNSSVTLSYWFLIALCNCVMLKPSFWVPPIRMKACSSILSKLIPEESSCIAAMKSNRDKTLVFGFFDWPYNSLTVLTFIGGALTVFLKIINSSLPD